MNFEANNDQEMKKLQLPIALATILLSFLGICLTIFFFIFNIRNRNFRYSTKINTYLITSIIFYHSYKPIGLLRCQVPT